jgi:hypothetical protein
VEVRAIEPDNVRISLGELQKPPKAAGHAGPDLE